MNDSEEKAFVQGRRRAWLSMFAECLRNLSYDTDEAAQAKWIVEREEAVRQLRALCRDFGDNDWPDNLSLADVINKHLGNHLRG